MFGDKIRSLFVLHETIIYREFNLSLNPVDILCFEKILLHCDIAKEMIYKQRRSGLTKTWTLTVNSGFKFVESFARGITWYMMKTEDVILSISFNLKNENTELVSFNVQSISLKYQSKKYNLIYECLYVSILTFI